MANLLHADLFISIHCNANPKRYINGLEIYYLNFTKNKEAIRIAARENASVNKKISDLRFILADLLINSKINESADFARILNTSLKNYLRRHYPGFRNNGVKKAPFYVLLGTQMPSILIELAYLSNSKDRHLLTNPNFLSRIAYGILKGIQNYQKQIQIYAWKK
jgi:N-acetylmuramoyl-L-alanine amidase